MKGKIKKLIEEFLAETRKERLNVNHGPHICEPTFADFCKWLGLNHSN